MVADVYNSCSGFHVRMYFFHAVYEASSTSSFIIIYVSKTDSALVNVNPVLAG